MIVDQEQEYQGLYFKSPIQISDRVSIVIGKNGSGKSRLIRAISEGQIKLLRDGTQISTNKIKSFPDGLQPNISFDFDYNNYRNAQSLIKSIYLSKKGSLIDNDTLGIIDSSFHSRQAAIDPQGFVRAVRAASAASRKNINDLDENEVVEFYSTASTHQMGAINLTAISREYLERQQKNEFNDFENHKYNLDLPYWTPEEFRERFGPPPWELLNELLKINFEEKYYVDPPKNGKPDEYFPSIRRVDGRQITPNNFSSGEKTLLWLCLSMYGTVSNLITGSIEVLLLDEPDAYLHAGMIQKLHNALELLVDTFRCSVLLTTHSPTTVALSGSENIWQINETSLTQVESDYAIAELLEGVDQVSIHYTNRRQVYVESYYDSVIYSKLFSYLKRQQLIRKRHISLSFIPAAPKLPIENIRQIHNSIFGSTDTDLLESFISQLNGQSNSVQVIGAVESLTAENNPTIYGIIDWDLKNKDQHRVYVHGPGVFYSIENAVLNPLTLTFFMLTHFPTKINLTDFGLNAAMSVSDLLSNTNNWQVVIDGFTELLLGKDQTSKKVICVFGEETKLNIDMRYAHHHGHNLEQAIMDKFPFLKKFKRRLLEEVLDNALSLSGIRTIPKTFLNVFQELQK